MTQFVTRSLPPRDRDDDRGGFPPKASVPVDPFLSASHDLFSIGALIRAQRVCFDQALNCCSTRRSEQLGLALACVRANAERIASLTGALQSKISADDFENATQVYGGE